MKCERSAEIAAFLKGETPEGERETLRLHFEGCPTCAKDLARFDRILQSLGKMESVDPSPQFRWRVREAFLHAHPEFLEKPVPERLTLWQSFRQTMNFIPAWSVSLAAHAVLIAIAAILLFVPRSPEEERDDSAVRARPRRPGRVTPAFDSGRGRPGDPSKTGRFSPEDPAVEYTPRDAVELEPDIKLPPLPRRSEATEKLDVTKWRERLPRERMFLAFFQGRSTESQPRDLREAYGGRGTESAVRRALEWLAKAQRADGAWSGPALASGPPGRSPYEVGLTGLSLLAFLAEGNTGKSGEFAATVSRGLDHLVGQQRASGLVGPDQGNYMYNHAIAGLALLEAAMMTKDEGLGAAAAAAVNFTVSAQNQTGGWGYTARAEENDTSVTGWQVLLLRMAKLSGNQGVIPSLIQAHERLRLKTDPEGRVGYWLRGEFPNGPFALTAVGMLAHQLSTHTPSAELLAAQSALLLEQPAIASTEPAGFAQNDLYFGLFGSLALHQAGGDAWPRWYGALKDKLLKAQQADGAWPLGFDRWHVHGGPVYVTAMATLILQSPMRYPRLHE
jgi:hypothetical protein